MDRRGKSRSAVMSPAGNNSHQGPPQNYHRAYKACVPCRQRKSRCEISAGWVPGEPCKRCRRQMKDCVFPTDRVTSKSSPRRLPALSTGDEPTETAPVTAIDPMPAEASQESPLTRSSSRELADDAFQDSSGGQDNGDLGRSVMRTMISSGSDALQLLFDPVRRVSRPAPSMTTQSPTGHRILKGPDETSPVQDVWNACRFVKQGWFSADEAIFYIDAFFQHFQRLSPILSDFYSKHENHYRLISSEPMLCCTILAISSRYLALPHAGGVMRSFFIHERLWSHIQHLLLRILLGQEKNSKGKTRTLGTIESLLLLTEWHPRSLTFPPTVDGWDSDLLVHWTEDRNDVPVENASVARGRWLEDVINPAQRSAHMSWMLISSAVSLACELGIFEDASTSPGSKHPAFVDEVQPHRHTRLQNLLYLYAEQITLQHGRHSILPQDLSHQIMRKSISVNGFGPIHSFLAAWTELTKLTRLVMETLYSSTQQTSQLLQSGRYVNLIEHFRPMLSTWKEKYLADDAADGSADLQCFANRQLTCLTAFNTNRNFLCMEYHSTRLYCHTLCIQAIIERSSLQGENLSASRGAPRAALSTNDYYFIEEVVNCSSQILHITVKLEEESILKYAPARVTQRIIVASIFLLKGLGIGVDGTRLQSSLELLQRAISALRSSAVDEMHLGLRYATLLDMHITRLHNSFVSSAMPPSVVLQGGLSTAAEGTSSTTMQDGFDMNQEDWLSLPFDATTMIGGMNDVQGFSGLYDCDLDFLWNLDFDPQQSEEIG